MIPRAKELLKRIKQMIITMHKDGESGRDISGLLKINFNIVTNFLRLFEKPGMLETKRPSGYPAKMTAPVAHYYIH